MDQGKSEMRSESGGGMRLNRFISMAGICSRREADHLIAEGRVTVNALPGTPGMRVGPGDQVLVDGRAVSHQAQPDILLAVNKPVGYVCSTDRRWGDQLLGDLVKTQTRVFPMGRLDKDSEGLILMTNRGDLLNKVMKAGNYHEKEYLVTVDRKVTEAFLRRMEQGVFLPELNVTTRPCRAEKTAPYSFRIVLTQGLNRQIRRMCVTLGYHVRSLKRIRVMNIRLGDLPVGKYRALTKEEIQELEMELRGSMNNPELKFREPGAGAANGTSAEADTMKRRAAETAVYGTNAAETRDAEGNAADMERRQNGT